ncbi:FACE1 [Symbiodinium natans]|uniref:FACE1 protein n=1 Tax=Symbiodinium natans TaxID=878477 RepID=A0A812I4Y4_9DINO|nr:FACE1 [Symbiodinium natans]
MATLQQTCVDRLQPSSGYGRISEAQASSVRLPVNPLPVDAMNSIQAQSDQTVKRVATLESTMAEVTRRLDDWTEVTRGGIADLRAEIGAVKLEQRFSQTLRNAPGDVQSSSRQATGPGGTPLEGGKQEGLIGEDLKQRLEVYEKKLSAIQSEHMFDATSMRERLEAALRESDNQTSRADELQALVKEEQGRRALLFVRLEAVEASVQDLRTNQRDIASANEVTERVLKGEFKKEASDLLEQLDVRLKALEDRSPNAEDTIKATADRSNNAAELGEMRSSLVSSTNDILRLAKEVATIREEHDQAIGDLGSLTERVAKSAIAGIQRSEERMAADLSGKRADFERVVAQQREHLEREAQAVIAEVKNLASGTASGSCSRGAVEEASNGRVEVALRRIDALARELRAEASAQAEASEARVASVEATFGSDLKRLRGMLSTCVSQLEAMQVELSQLVLARVEPRVASLEAKMGPQVEDLTASTDTGLSRSVAETSSTDGVHAKWMGSLSKVKPSWLAPPAERTILTK